MEVDTVVDMELDMAMAVDMVLADQHANEKVRPGPTIMELDTVVDMEVDMAMDMVPVD
jgi:hypothetical protein